MSAIELIQVAGSGGSDPASIFQSLGLGSIPAGVMGLILILLNRKNANKKLEIEETGADVNQFDVITKKYQQIADNWEKTAESAQKATEAAEKATKLALTELQKHKADRESISDKLQETNTKLDQIRRLFTSVMKRSNIILSPQEQEIFDATVPSKEIKSRVRKASTV